jgi:hypothetical protein
MGGEDNTPPFPPLIRLISLQINFFWGCRYPDCGGLRVEAAWSGGYNPPNFQGS